LKTIGSNDVFFGSSDQFGGAPVDRVPALLEESPSEPTILHPRDANDSNKNHNLVIIDQSSRNFNIPTVQAFGEREYGIDTRVVSALIRASAQAMDRNGIGTIWAGRDNGGFLCENSLRLITTRWEPSYRNTSVPGINTTKAGIGALRHVDERSMEEESKPGKRKKFRGLYVDEADLPSFDDTSNSDWNETNDLSDHNNDEQDAHYSSMGEGFQKELSKNSHSNTSEFNDAKLQVRIFMATVCLFAIHFARYQMRQCITLYLDRRVARSMWKAFERFAMIYPDCRLQM
jgi:hypothetical protein